MGSSTSTEEPPTPRRPNVAPTFSNYRPEASLHRQRSPYHQSEVSRNEPSTSSHRPIVSRHQTDIDNKLKIATGDAFVKTALEKCNCTTVLQVFVGK